jgi:hypothetical protein
LGIVQAAERESQLSDKTSEREFHQAIRALQGFYEATLEEVVAAVLEKGDSLHTGYLGSGETLVDRYGPLMLHLSNMIGCMHRAASKPPPPPVYGSEAVTAPEEEIHETLNQWFLDHPEFEPVTVQILPGETEARAVIVYQAGPE